MPLFVNLAVNADDLLELKIVRLDRTPPENVKPDDVFKYRVSRHNDTGEWQKLFELEHRYGDGAESLAGKVLLGVADWKLSSHGSVE